MKANRSLYVLLLLLVFVTLGCRETQPAVDEDLVTVRFEVEVPGTLYPYTRPFLAGTFNDWNPADSAYAMHPTVASSALIEESSTPVFYLEIPLALGDSVEYKYTLGEGWHTVEVDADAADLPNRQLLVQANHTQFDRVAHWKLESVNRGLWSRDEIAFIQERFITARFQGYTKQPQTEAEMDALFATIEHAWHEQAVHYPPLPHLTSQSYLLAYAIQQWTSHDRDEMLCYMMRQYQLGALQKDLGALQAEPHLGKVRLLDDLVRALPFALTCEDFEADAWETMTAMRAALPDLLTTYEALADTTLPFLSYEDLRAQLAATERAWEIKAAMMEGDLEAASYRLEQTLYDAGGSHRTFLPAVGMQLAQRLDANGDTHPAFRTLDGLALHTFAHELSEEKLLAAYKDLGASDAEKRVEQLLTGRSREQLEGTGAPIDLSGIYVDVTHDAIFDLATLKGKTVLIDFWATWCGPCIAEIPDLIAYAERVKDLEDFVFLSVSSDALSADPASIQDVKAFIQEKGITYIVLYDDPENALTERFDITGWPTKILLDREGKIITRRAELRRYRG